MVRIGQGRKRRVAGRNHDRRVTEIRHERLEPAALNRVVVDNKDAFRHGDSKTCGEKD